MVRRILLFTLVALAAILTGCGDDDECTVCPEPSIGLYGKWQIVSGDLTAVWLVVDTDNTYHELYENEFGFRWINSDVCMVTEDQVIMNWGLVYNYCVSHDTLYLTRPEVSVTAVRDIAGPADSDWIAYLPAIGFLDEMNAPVEVACDIAFDGQRLWYGNGYASDYLYIIDTSLLSVVDSLNTGQSAWAVELAGSRLWCGSNGSNRIYELNPNTGATITTSATMGAWIEGIAWDGDYLWCGSNNERSIYVYDPVSNTVPDTFFVDVAVHGMAWEGNLLYVCAEGVLNICAHTGTLDVVGSYRMRNAQIEGVAFDGLFVWLMAVTDDGYKIYRYAWYDII